MQARINPAVPEDLRNSAAAEFAGRSIRYRPVNEGLFNIQRLRKTHREKLPEFARSSQKQYQSTSHMSGVNCAVFFAFAYTSTVFLLKNSNFTYINYTRPGAIHPLPPAEGMFRSFWYPPRHFGFPAIFQRQNKWRALKYESQFPFSFFYSIHGSRHKWSPTAIYQPLSIVYSCFPFRLPPPLPPGLPVSSNASTVNQVQFSHPARPVPRPALPRKHLSSAIFIQVPWKAKRRSAQQRE